MAIRYYRSDAETTMTVPHLVGDGGTAVIEPGDVFGSPVKLDFAWVSPAKKGDAEGDAKVYRQRWEPDPPGGEPEQGADAAEDESAAAGDAGADTEED